jgi:hypothetical protein
LVPWLGIEPKISVPQTDVITISPPGLIVVLY